MKHSCSLFILFILICGASPVHAATFSSSAIRLIMPDAVVVATTTQSERTTEVPTSGGGALDPLSCAERLEQAEKEYLAGLLTQDQLMSKICETDKGLAASWLINHSVQSQGEVENKVQEGLGAAAATSSPARVSPSAMKTIPASATSSTKRISPTLPLQTDCAQKFEKLKKQLLNEEITTDQFVAGVCSKDKAAAASWVVSQGFKNASGPQVGTTTHENDSKQKSVFEQISHWFTSLFW